MNGSLLAPAEDLDDENVSLVDKDLAFSTPNPNDNGGGETAPLVKATVRAPFDFREDPQSCSFLPSLYGGSSVKLNTEFFGDPSWPRILLFVHGVCASAETWSIQNVARTCASQNWRLAVLELEGHGLSGGRKGLIGASWELCVKQVVRFCKHALKVDRFQKKKLAKTEADTDTPAPRFAIGGSSLGGALASYASQEMATEDTQSYLFAGTLLFSPAVGVDPSVVPPKHIVGALSVASWIVPSVGIQGATPTEDPTSYNCPSWTKRNFVGAWPLGTSKLLLDATSTILPYAIETGSLNLLVPPPTTARAATNSAIMCTTTTARTDEEEGTRKKRPKRTIVVISGVSDPVVPIEAVHNFVDGMKRIARKRLVNEPKNSKDDDDDAIAGADATIELIEIEKGDHGLLSQSDVDPLIGKDKKKAMATTIEHVVLFLKRCEAIDG